MVLLLGCSAEPDAKPPRTMLLPNAALQPAVRSGISLPGHFGYATVMERGGCATRYEFAGEAAPVECTTDLVGGDPNHWLTECPDHRMLAVENETIVNAAARPLMLREVRRVEAGLETFVSYSTYDATGRLTGIVSGPTPWEAAGTTLSVTSYSPGGQPTHMVTTGSVLHATEELFVPGSESSEIDVTYDELDRVIGRRMRNTGVGAWDGYYYDEFVVYDDAAGRIDYEVDVAYNFNDRPDHPVNPNIGYQLYDEQNRLVALHAEEGGMPFVDLTFSFDDDGRVITTTYDNHEAGIQFVAHEMYDCP